MQAAHFSRDYRFAGGRWFGLPGAFMAGIVCGALIAAVGYAQWRGEADALGRLSAPTSTVQAWNTEHI